MLSWFASPGIPSLSHRAGPPFLLAHAVLLPIAVLLFRLGTDYNLVTALSIAVTIVQWVTFVEAFEPAAPSSNGSSRQSVSAQSATA